MPHREAQLGLPTIVYGEALKQQAAEARAGATANRVVDEEALQPRAVVRQLPDAVQAQIHNLLPDRVVPARKVVRGVLLTGDELLGMEELTVGARADLVNQGWLQVDEDTPGNVLACTGLGEERVERIVTAADRLVRRHLPVRLDTMFKAEQLPARIAELATGLTHVDGDALTHGC